MKIKCYKPLSNWLSWVVLILMIGTSPIIQAATNCDAVTEISKGECESLLELYNSTNGANWKNNSGWNVTNTPCSWYGVSCSSGGVIKIKLENNQLSGSIPNFNALPNLQYLQKMEVASQVLLKRIIITATPEQCYKFTAWGGACSGTSSSCRLTMDSNKSVTANFEIQSFQPTRKICHNNCSQRRT